MASFVHGDKSNRARKQATERKRQEPSQHIAIGAFGLLWSKLLASIDLVLRSLDSHDVWSDKREENQPHFRLVQ
jgi:hypothetical protein